MFDLQASYFRLLCIDECAMWHISGNTKKRIVKKLKPSGGLARRRTGPGLPYVSLENSVANVVYLTDIVANVTCLTEIYCKRQAILQNAVLE